MSKPEVLTKYHDVIRFDALHWGEADMPSRIRRELNMSPRTYRRILREAVGNPRMEAAYPNEVRRIRYRLDIGRDVGSLPGLREKRARPSESA
jgi:hypothetical protein